jgi:hypothetical protein
LANLDAGLELANEWLDVEHGRGVDRIETADADVKSVDVDQLARGDTEAATASGVNRSASSRTVLSTSPHSSSTRPRRSDATQPIGLTM